MFEVVAERRPVTGPDANRRIRQPETDGSDLAVIDGDEELLGGFSTASDSVLRSNIAAKSGECTGP